jgi:hypothetical protein
MFFISGTGGDWGRLGYYFRSWFTVHESVGSCRKYVKLANLCVPLSNKVCIAVYSWMS